MRKSALQGVGAMITSEVLREWFPLSSLPVRGGKLVLLGVFYGAGVHSQQRGLNHLCHRERPFLCPRREATAGAE